jgi:hypothetical protein
LTSFSKMLQSLHWCRGLSLLLQLSQGDSIV